MQGCDWLKKSQKDRLMGVERAIVTKAPLDTSVIQLSKLLSSN